MPRLCELLENRSLFEAVDPLKTEYNDTAHLAHITALLDPPPQKLLARGNRTSLFYDPEGEFLFEDSPRVCIVLIYETGELKSLGFSPQTGNLESSVTKIEGQDKRMFLAFVRRMLTWQPEYRSTAKELLSDPWLGADFPAE